MKEKLDAVIVTITLHAPLPAELPEDPLFRGVDQDGLGRFRLAHARIEAIDAEERQRQFMDLLETAGNLLSGRFSGIDAADSADAGVDIHLTLTPRSGQAGIVIPDTVLRDLAKWNPSVYIDALR